MGFDQGNSQDFSKGMGVFGEFLDFFDPPESQKNIDMSADREEMARMMELDARQSAMDVDKASRETSSQLHQEQEQQRSARNAEWGQSNLAMSGSKELVRESNEVTDKSVEEDALADGEASVQEILSRGRREANLYRIANGVSPSRSILSLGSTIYNKKR